MRITPLDIRHQEFRKCFRGIDVKEVSQFLELAAVQLEEMIKENNLLKAELKRKDLYLSDYRERESTLKEALLTAQRVKDDIKKNAEREAEVIISEAELKAERMVTEAQNRLNNLIADIQALKMQRTQFESELKAIIDFHLKLLEASQERAGGAIEDKVRVLKGSEKQ